jgi:hypothetical protein
MTVVFHATGQTAEADVLPEFWRGSDVAVQRVRGTLPPDVQSRGDAGLHWRATVTIPLGIRCSIRCC